MRDETFAHCGFDADGDPTQAALEFRRYRCYICAMMARRGGMLRITGPVLG